MKWTDLFHPWRIARWMLPPRDYEDFRPELPDREPGEEIFAGRFWGVFWSWEIDGSEDAPVTERRVAAEPVAIFSLEASAQRYADLLQAAEGAAPGFTRNRRAVVSRVDLVGLVWHSLFHDDPRSVGAWATNHKRRRKWYVWSEAPRELRQR